MPQDNKDQETPGPVFHVSDQGLTSPEAAPATTDAEPSSALGGGTATRTTIPDDEGED